MLTPVSTTNMPHKKPKPMSDWHFRVMVWLYKLTDLFSNPERHLEKMPLREGMVVVDYGCGPGRYTIPIAELIGPQGKVFAVDIQPLAVKLVKEKAALRSLANIESVLVDSFDTGIRASTADMVLLIDTVHLIDDHDALFHEIRRILKPNGLLFMDSGHMKTERVKQIVESTGLFTLVEQKGQDMLLTKEPTKEKKR